MPTSKNILILIDNYQREKFFLRFHDSLIKLAYQPIYISPYPTSKKNIPSRYLKIIEPTKKTEKNWPIKNCIEYLLKQTNERITNNIYGATYHTIKKIASSEDCLLCIMWNGARTMSRAATQACEEANIKTLYIEISNLPGKIIADTKGMNSESEFYRNPDILKNHKEPTKNHQTWRDTYISNKLKNSSVPQAAFAKKIDFRFAYDYTYWKLGKGIQLFNIAYAIKSALNKLRLKKVKIKENSPPETSYVFLPLQCNNDSQLIFHSDIGNLEAIKIAKKIANDTNHVLVIKPHPAESDAKFLKKLIKQQKAKEITISNVNTCQLIQGATLVITINSTVGLEAIIQEKAVEFLGKSIYKHLNSENISKFIHSYLLPIDYFSCKEVDPTATQEMIKRAIKSVQ